MGLLITKEWLLSHVPTQIKEVDKYVSKLNTKIQAAKRAGLEQYTWEAYEIKDELIENIDKITFDLVLKEIEIAGYDYKVEVKEPMRRTRVIISWSDKPLEEPEPKLPPHMPVFIVPPPIVINDNILTQEQKFKKLQEYEKQIVLYLHKIEVYRRTHQNAKIKECEIKINEINALKNQLLTTMK